MPTNLNDEDLERLSSDIESSRSKRNSERGTVSSVFVSLMFGAVATFVWFGMVGRTGDLFAANFFVGAIALASLPVLVAACAGAASGSRPGLAAGVLLVLHCVIALPAFYLFSLSLMDQSGYLPPAGWVWYVFTAPIVLFPLAVALGSYFGWKLRIRARLRAGDGQNSR